MARTPRNVVVPFDAERRTKNPSIQQVRNGNEAPYTLLRAVWPRLTAVQQVIVSEIATCFAEVTGARDARIGAQGGSDGQ